ncbi:Uma2 family endonuclease [Streptomyces sp. NPDC014870]|uniref:Uma2 family endonuclease n=1 Tax=Streptomyces sp. NPDC014870 TaxID=3364925 RepID=UPI0036FBEA55
MSSWSADSTNAAVEQAFQKLSAAEPEGWRVELIRGQIHVTEIGDGQHASIVAELRDQLFERSRESALSCYGAIGLDLPGPSGGTDHVVPDLTVAPKGSHRDRLVWHAPGPVLLVAEVTSASTAGRDRDQKARGYADAGIPLYLLIDREADEVVVHAEPLDGGYAARTVHRVGTVVALPSPLGFEVDTSEF